MPSVSTPLLVSVNAVESTPASEIAPPVRLTAPSGSAVVPIWPPKVIAPVPEFAVKLVLPPVTAPSVWLKLPAAEVIVVSEPSVTAPNVVFWPSASVPLVVTAPKV